MIVTAYDNEGWRLQRVNKAAKIARAILGVTDGQFGALVYQMHDEKGTLKVQFFHDWTANQATAFQQAWELCGESNVRCDRWVF